MAAILVDYENVHATSGLKGVEYLNEQDILIIFYSHCCGKIRAEYLEAIEKSGCEFMIRKLAKTGKNGLDFYIASECGYISQTGETQIAIVSRDKGFAAVSDYFQVNPELKDVMVAVAGNVENALMVLNAPDDIMRRNILQEKARTLDMEAEFARIQEQKELRRKIEEAFSGTEYVERITDILEYVEANRNCSPKLFYTGSLHRFGRIDGTTIYRMLKTVI